MTKETQDKIKEIKRSFRLMMNGETSRSMREKGMEYKINWGVPFIDLKNMAKEYGKDYELAIELWKEDIRECKILATLIMPAEKMLQEVVDIWMEQIKSQEIAEMASFNLYQNLEYAPILAYRWIASDKIMEQICGYQVLSRLFMKGHQPNERGTNEFMDQVHTALQSDDIRIKHAALNCVMRFMELCDDNEGIARKTLKGIVEL